MPDPARYRHLVYPVAAFALRPLLGAGSGHGPAR